VRVIPPAFVPPKKHSDRAKKFLPAVQALSKSVRRGVLVSVAVLRHLGQTSFLGSPHGFRHTTTAHDARIFPLAAG
jgi:hypothetical protein